MRGGCNCEFVGGRGGEQSIAIKICCIDAWNYKKKLNKKMYAISSNNWCTNYNTIYSKHIISRWNITKFLSVISIWVFLRWSITFNEILVNNHNKVVKISGNQHIGPLFGRLSIFQLNWIIIKHSTIVLCN